MCMVMLWYQVVEWANTLFMLSSAGAMVVRDQGKSLSERLVMYGELSRLVENSEAHDSHGWTRC